MTMQILVPIHTYPDSNAPSLAAQSVSIAEHLAGEIHALELNVRFAPMHSPFSGLMLDVPAMVSQARAQSRQAGAALVASFEKAASDRDVKLRISQIEEVPTALGEAISQNARYHDLCVLGLGRDKHLLRQTAEDVIFRAGTPALLVPEDAETANYSNVSIAWDGSSVAARAVRDAWPFLKRATTISILSVHDEKALPAEDIGQKLAKYLDQHGLKAQALKISTKGRPISDTLQEHAGGKSGGILVMGGFGYSRLRDFVLGGATNGILQSLAMPVFLSH
ncbi:universal stress protein [Rhizobium sp. LjRoot30]|uniref:universal stress protein n=1 Tax=Rhizobium sp. LjRoot30 TaxID=3342320 RepID=UPI003ECC43E4